MKSFKLLAVLTLALSAQQAAILQAQSAPPKAAKPAAKTPVVVSVKGEDVMKKSKRGNKNILDTQEDERKQMSPVVNQEKAIKNQELELLKKQKDLNDRAKELEEKSKILSQEAQREEFENLQEEKRKLEEAAHDLQRAMQKLNDEFKRIQQKLKMSYQEKMAEFDKEVKETIQALAIENGWDIVLMQESLVYSSAKVDVTDTVIAKLDVQETARLEKKAKAQKPTQPAIAK